jgi:hypothetical protein
MRESIAGWSSALEAHRLAPPDSGFSARLSSLAAAAGEQARVYRAAAPDYEWVPNSSGQPPYELQPGSGRRGPQKLWHAFDDAVAQLSEATEGQDMLTVAHAYERLAAAAARLAQAIEREDLAPQRPPARTRARRTA